MHTEAHLFSVPNDCLWYDKLRGPSQRVVTLFISITCHYLSIYLFNCRSSLKKMGSAAGCGGLLLGPMNTMLGLSHSSMKELLPPGRGSAGVAQQCPVGK